MNSYCPNCAAILEDFIEDSCMGQRCHSCGWSVVTTFTPPILEDERVYTVTLLEDNLSSPNILKTISRLMDCNYIKAKELVLEAPSQLCSGYASEILEQIAALEDAGVKIAISPRFPYDRDGKLLDEAHV